MRSRDERADELPDYTNEQYIEMCRSRLAEIYAEQGKYPEIKVQLRADRDGCLKDFYDMLSSVYIRETKTYYSYRDKKWKWYKNDIKYSDYSSTQPAGYKNKDKATLKNTELSEWSLDYPEEFEYRHISTKTGYQWYKKEGKEKVYWENGKYLIIF